MVHPGTTRSLMLGLILAAFFVAGCGGGGDDVSRGTHDMLQEELDDALAMLMATETERDTAQAEVTRLTGELATATDSVTSLTDQLDTANDSVTSLMSELSDAEAEVTRLTNQIGSVTDPTSLQGLLSAANNDVTRLMGELNTANADVMRLTTERNDARAQITRLEARLDTALDRVQEVEDDLDDLEGVENQVTQLQGQLTAAQQAELSARATSFHGSLDGPDGAMATVSWMRDRSLIFRPQGTLTAGTSAPSVPGSWRSASFTGQTGTAAALVNETVYMYTNIQSPGTRAFWKEYGLEETMSDALQAHARGSSARPNADTNTTLEGHQYDMLMVSGSFRGASGTFTCGCSGNVADGYDSHVMFAQGVPTFTSPGSWVFEPGSISNGYRLDQDDAFLYFGIWSSIPTGIAAEGYNFRYIAGGGSESGATLGRFNALTGSATFRGGAVGRYTTLGQLGQQNAKIGTFTATATLNADFGADNVAGTLHGSITDFREGGSSLSGWSVTLGGANVGTPVDIASGAATGATVANIGGLSVAGSWGAEFHGDSNEDLDNDVMYPETRYPPVDLAGVTGWFDATGDDASLAGAFGATP